MKAADAHEEGAARSDTETGIDLGRRLAPGTLLAGRYRIDTVLGAGAMGVVYRAQDEELGTLVAVKVLRPDLAADPRLLERFRRELVLARQVTHRNVVRIHDIGESDGVRFLTMSFVDGRSLLAILQEGPLPLERALAAFRQLADALQDAHDAGVVHRDLKPANVLVDNAGTAYITDFGVARSLVSVEGFTRAGAVVGTPDYLSPEQVTGEPVDGRSDLFALGILLYEMLTAQLPFEGATQAEAVARRLGGRPRDLAAAGVTVPRYVQAIIRRLLERDPSRRYPTARALIADLDGQRAPRTMPPPRAWLFLAVAVALGAGGWWWARSGTPPAGGRETAVLEAPSGVSSAAPAVAFRHALAVLPLADETADPRLAWTTTGVPEMLSQQLAGSADLRVLDAPRVLRTMRDLQLASGRYDDATLRRVASLVEVDRVVTGSVRKAGGTVRFELRVVAVSPTGGLETRSLAVESRDDGDLFRAVAELGERLRSELGARAPGGPDPGPGTQSVDAARSYQEGLRRLAVGDSVGAAPALERAVAADPAFAAAFERLSEAYQSLGYSDKALTAAERAADAAGSGDARLQHRIAARLALLRGEPAKAEASYAELARLVPSDLQALLDLAAAQGAKGDIDTALVTLRRASEVDPSDPRVWFLLGRNSILSGDAARAASDYLVRALTLQTRLRNEQGQADAENALGIAYQELGQLPEAVEKFTAAAERRRKLGDERGHAGSLKNRARARVALGQFAPAEPDLAAARTIYERIGDQSGLADVLNEQGVLLEGRGRYAQARRAYQEALRLRTALGDERQIGQSQDNVGYMFFLEGEYDSALVYWQQALERRRSIGDKSGEVLSLQNLGFLWTAQGRWPEALKSFVDALEKARAVSFVPGVAVSQGNIGVLHHLDGRHAAALTSLREALTQLRTLGDTRGIVEFTLKEAAVLLDLGRDAEAKERLDAAAVALAGTGNHEQAADHALLGAEWHRRRGEDAPAEKARARALAEAKESHSGAALLRAQLAADGAAPATASAALAAREREAEARGDALLRIHAAEAVARGHLARGRAKDGEPAAVRAVRLAERVGWHAGLFRLHALAARIHEAAGDRAAADREWARARREVERIREGLTPELRTSFDAQAEVKGVLASGKADGS